MQNYGYVEYGFIPRKGEISPTHDTPQFNKGVGDWEVVKDFIPKNVLLPQIWTGYGENETALFETGYFRLLDETEHIHEDVFTYEKRVPFRGIKTIKEVREKRVIKKLKDITETRWCWWRTTKGIEFKGKQTNYIQFVLYSDFLDTDEIWAIVDAHFGQKLLKI